MNESDIMAGGIFKSAKIESNSADEADMRLINKYTLEPLKADDVFTFKCIAADNETDDRNFMPFTAKALRDLKKLYVGKTVIKDHRRSTDNQIARVYATELITDENKTTGRGEPYTELVLKCYMVKTAENEGLISEIKAGIKREVSTHSSCSKVTCSICGADNAKGYCSHFPGRKYEKDGNAETCLMTIEGCKEAYEVSFVPIPAQPRAATYKAFGETIEYAPEEKTTYTAELEARIRLAEMNIETEEYDNE